MKNFLILSLLLSSLAFADTPPPNTVKSKTYSGDGATAITATGSSLNVNITNPPDLTTVNQGNAGSQSWLVDVTQSALPSGAATSAKQPSLGTAGSASSNVITVQGISSMTPLKTDGSDFTQPVSVQSMSALVAGSAIVGKVGIDQTLQGTTNLVTLGANQSVNVNQINGATPLMGNGNTGTGSPRVTIAADNTPFTVKVTPNPSALTVRQAAITIGTSAVRLTADGLVPPSTRVLLTAQLLSSSTANCYFGSSSVTSSGVTRGVQMLAAQTFAFSNDAGDYYAICDNAAQTFLLTEQE